MTTTGHQRTNSEDEDDAEFTQKECEIDRDPAPGHLMSISHNEDIGAPSRQASISYNERIGVSSQQASNSYDERIADTFKTTSSLMAIGKGFSEFLEHCFPHGSFGQQLMGIRVAEISLLAGTVGLWYPLSQIINSLSKTELPSPLMILYSGANAAELIEGALRLAAFRSSKYLAPAIRVGIFVDGGKAITYWKKGDRQTATMYACFGLANTFELASFCSRKVNMPNRAPVKSLRYVAMAWAVTGVVVGARPSKWLAPDNGLSTIPGRRLMSTRRDDDGLQKWERIYAETQMRRRGNGRTTAMRGAQTNVDE